ncbi:hypothetical protein [Microbispora sp. H10836]|uniref:hypothetical protein n=2 Tax=Microbispora TaxID=2005 RepID=UPI00289377C2|nr:hypothetical protein [Microbispora sp. H10836]
MRGPAAAAREAARPAAGEGAEAMLVQLTMRRTDGQAAPGSPVDGIRVLALLPGSWHKHLEQVAGDIVIRIRAEGTTAGGVRAEVARILTSPEVSHLELVACRPLEGPRQ